MRIARIYHSDRLIPTETRQPALVVAQPFNLMGLDPANLPTNLRRAMLREPVYAQHHPHHHPRKTPKLERAALDATLGAAEGKEEAPGRVHIRFESARKRLLDPDNLSEKWALDCLRYVGVIRGDEPDKITLETTQRKCAKDEEEHTEIVITYP